MAEMPTVTDRVLVGCIVGITVADVTLIRRGHPPLSSNCRATWRRRTAVGLLALHLVFSWKHDPLHLLAERLRKEQRDDRILA